LKQEIYEYVIVRERDEELDIVAGPHCVAAANSEEVRIVAVVTAKLREAEGIRVLVRPFLRA